MRRFLSRNSICQESLEWHPECWKIKNCEPRILYLAKLSFKYEGEIKPFPDKQKLREFKIIRPVSQEMLEEALQAKVESCW